MITESEDHLQKYQARMLEVARSVEVAVDRLEREPALQMNKLHPNRRKALDDIERMLIECRCLCRLEAARVYYFVDDGKEDDK